MSKNRRVNPNKVPATQADVKRAKRDGAEAGLVIAVWAAVKRLEENDVPEEGIQQYASDVMDVCENINKGYLKYADIKKALLDQYGIEVSLS